MSAKSPMWNLGVWWICRKLLIVDFGKNYLLVGVKQVLGFNLAKTKVRVSVQNMKFQRIFLGLTVLLEINKYWIVHFSTGVGSWISIVLSNIPHKKRSLFIWDMRWFNFQGSKGIAICGEFLEARGMNLQLWYKMLQSQIPAITICQNGTK